MQSEREYLRRKYEPFRPCEFAEKIIKLCDENERMERILGRLSKRLDALATLMEEGHLSDDLRGKEEPK